MSFITILLFFVYCYGLGFAVSSFAKNSENFLERNLMRIGFGLSILPFLVLVLNLAKIPADWRIILALSLAYPAYFIFRNYKNFYFNNLLKMKITKTDISILLMLLIFAWNFYIYLSGAFAYPYLEDDDSWAHTFGAKYVSMRGNVFAEETSMIRYVNPYPPAYDVVIGVLHQTNNSLYWTMKFFNALIISLSTVFFYFFVKELTGNRNKALFAAFALMSVPAFMSHFIWAISIAVPLYFAAFYAMERIKYGNKNWILAALVMVSAFIASPTHSTYFGLLLALYLIAKAFIEGKKVIYYGLAGISGLALSFIFWWLPVLLTHGLRKTLIGLSIISSGGQVTSGGGTGDRVYNFQDFFIAQKQNMINNPIGLGIFLTLLTFAAIITVYCFLFKLINSTKNDSRNKYYIGISLFMISILLFAIGSFFILSSNKYNPKVTEDAKVLKEFVKSKFQYFYFSIIILLALLFYYNKNIEESNKWLVIAIIWFVFAFFAVNSSPYPYKISPFRAWMVLAIPVCILAAEGAFALSEIGKKYAGNLGAYALVALLLLGIYFTSTQQKIAVNTANWPPGAFWTSGEEIHSYLWMKDNLPKNSKVFTFWNNGPVIGMDMYSCHWCQDVRGYMDTGFNKSVNENYNWLKSRDYEYLIIDGQTVKWFGANETIAKLQDLAQSGLFKPEFQNQGAVIFKI